MDTSKRAVESYWRSRMIDGVTTDEDKVAPVYKLEEICELLRTSDASIVKEVSEFIFRRLDHKSPIVKQKALRLIKYAVGKSGTEFRREMQRNSAAIRQLLHYKGELDSLKGDAPNKAVRDIAQEAITALFSSDDSKAAAPLESINKRIEGFGNTNYEMPTAEKKSFLSEVVGLGTASIIHGITSLAASRSLKTNDNGTYRSPNLRRSLTIEADGGQDRYEPVSERHGDRWQSSGSSRNVATGSWNTQARNSMTSTAISEENSSSNVVSKSREERLLETIVTAGDLLLVCLRKSKSKSFPEVKGPWKKDQSIEAEEGKLKGNPVVNFGSASNIRIILDLRKVRMKAICVLESILRKKGDDDYCSIIASYFSENTELLIKCCELPQSSLREKASKVLCLLGGEQLSETANELEATEGKPRPVSTVQLPDLIDTGDTYDEEDSNQTTVDPSSGDLMSGPSFSNDLLDVAPISDSNINRNKNEDDPFADVSFHVSDEKHKDIFSGLTVDDSKADQLTRAENKSELFVELNSGHTQSENKENLHDLMARFSLSGQNNFNTRTSGIGFLGTDISHGSVQQSHGPSDMTFNGMHGSNAFYPMAAMQYNMQPNFMFNPALSTQPMNYGAMGGPMGAFIAQQQLVFQNAMNVNSGYGNVAGITTEGGHSSPLPDIFHLSNNPVQNCSTVLNNTKKEDTKAFDFISEHVSAARDPKRIR
ncbi:hypothetical protein HPP92_008092 [Vanilla planifolia]|uniref:VHS domain-containing protein n=1 Tax=Vanilla planifolia TaxID=51239 RepID=A0A835VAN8_VANPL|nr:hypothetical protein HPP92_008092 [Vanilla planifolia]